jgi:transposase
MEATGKYHRLAHVTLETLGFQVMVINPFQSRHFAKAMNVLCKTDKVDAKVLSMYAERMEFKPTASLCVEESELQELLRHLDDLKGTKVDLEARLEGSGKFIKKSLERTVKGIKEEISKTEDRINQLIEGSAKLKAAQKILVSIPGVGATTATVLLGLLRELGTLSSKEVASLAGLAPMNVDSGKMQGKRRIQKGRHDVRSHLYMPIIGAATKHNPVLKALYRRLVDAGKPAKVALTACMRKLVIYANAMLKKNEIWQYESSPIKA